MKLVEALDGGAGTQKKASWLRLAASVLAVLSASSPASPQVPALEAGTSTAAATVNLNITPKRLTFDRATRTATVYVFNQGNAAATFDISLVDRVMLPTGEIKPAAEAAADPQHKSIAAKLQSARSMVLVSPRRAVLAPGKGQTIRVRVSPPVSSELSEYRSHLTVATVPDRELGLSAEAAAAGGQQQLSFRVSSVFGLSIPLIIRSGAADVAGALESIRLERQSASSPGAITLVLRRAGKSSLFGNLEVKSKGALLGQARGIGVYTEIEHRQIRVPLTKAPRPGDRLEISFVDDDSTPGRLIASSALVAP